MVKLFYTKAFRFLLILLFIATLLISCSNAELRNEPSSESNVNQDVEDSSVEKTNKDTITKFSGVYDYDVIVISGEPEGIAAAVSAARNGLKTLLVEYRDGLGGLMTYGMLNFLDLSYDLNGNPTSAGIFKEWHEKVGSHITFDIEEGKTAFLEIVQNEKNLSFLFNTKVTKVITDKNKLIGVEIENNEGIQTIYAKRFIDSTPDADIAYLAGVPHYNGNEDIGLDRKMAVTLMIHLKNVDWNGIKKAIDSSKFGWANMNQYGAWGFEKLHYIYKPVEKDTRLRGLNVARQNDGTVVINALQIFGVDPFDKVSYENGLERGVRETNNIVQFLRKSFPGFENAEIASFPSELYVRETRHIQAEYQLKITDLWENKDQWDSIGIAAYPVDVQATSIDNYGYIITKPKQYSLPFRSLVPLKIDNLLVASKASGYSSLAAGSARVIPTGMVAGEAAGVASALSISKNLDYREMIRDKETISQLQQKLKEQGALLYSFNLDYPYKGEWYYPAIAKLLTYGLLSGGYDNNLYLEKSMNESEFLYLLANGIEQIDNNKYLSEVKPKFLNSLYSSKKGALTRNRMAEFLVNILGNNNEEISEKAYWDKAIHMELIDETISKKITTNRKLNRAEIYYIVANILNSLDK